jgi:predicted ATPase
MEIKNLKISNYKSIKHIELKDINSFSVFVGPNAAGKSNIFEALDFFNQCYIKSDAFDALRLFGKIEDILNRNTDIYKNIAVGFILNNDLDPHIEIMDHPSSFSAYGHNLIIKDSYNLATQESELGKFDTPELKQFYNFTHLFIGNSKVKRNNYIDDLRLNADASNLELVLKRILKNEILKEELIEELQLLIPGFDNIEVRSDEISGTDTLLVYEQGTKKPFGKNLLSDGTYNIISLLVAVYQSEKPQFLCIEEPENGLNPFVAKEFVRIFRDACTNKGHFIWINTHSQSILSELKQKEVIIVDKINGGTIAKQIDNIDLHGLKLDEALFTNVLGGGTPW